jgi:glucose-1-phosphate thymidylyltransferase
MIREGKVVKNRELKSIKGILVAGGGGSRLYPFTKYTHKTLLPLNDRPVIDYALAIMRRAGIKDIIIIANEHIGQIAKHIGVGLEGERIHYVIENEPKGVCNALNLARPHVEGHRIMLYFSDNITTWDFSSDAKLFLESDKPPGAVLLARKVNNPEAFGICVMNEDEEVIDIIEKPGMPYSSIAIGGIYLFDELFWNYLDMASTAKGPLFSISDITRIYIKNQNFTIHNIGPNTWIDCGTPDGLLEASIMARNDEISWKVN